jgi:hypothetical protein
MNPLDDLFRQAEANEIPGGCDQCEAYQTVESTSPGVHMIFVHHDDLCPILQASRIAP